MSAPTPASDPTAALLNDRALTHGKFDDNAHYAQLIKLLKQQAGGDVHWTAVQNEAFDLIATKLGRILSGQASFVDHWADIAGYAQLVVKELTRPAPKPQDDPANQPDNGLRPAPP